MTKTGVIVQARMGSTRFKNKMTNPFYENEGMLYFLLSRLKQTGIDAKLVLAIPDTKENDVLESIGKRLHIAIYRGSENDVLQRFIGAAKEFQIENIVRVCADNPFLDTDSIKILFALLSESNTDYISFCLSDHTPTIKTHYGFWPEAVRLSALERVAESTIENLYREHVTNYIYTHPQQFTRHCIFIDPEIERASLRFTVDTQTDFESMQVLAQHFSKGQAITPGQVIHASNQYPEICKLMLMEIEKNRK